MVAQLFSIALVFTCRLHCIQARAVQPMQLASQHNLVVSFYMYTVLIFNYIHNWMKTEYIDDSRQHVATIV